MTNKEERSKILNDLDRIKQNEAPRFYTRDEGNGQVSANASEGVLGRHEWRDQMVTLYDAKNGEATLISRDQYGTSVALDITPKEAYQLIGILKKFINTEYGKNN